MGEMGFSAGAIAAIDEKHELQKKLDAIYEAHKEIGAIYKSGKPNHAVWKASGNTLNYALKTERFDDETIYTITSISEQ